MTFHTWSKGVSRECVFRQNHRPVEEAGIWVEAVTSRRPVIINHYEDTGSSLKGCLPGHVPVHRLMSVPLFNGEQIAGVAAAANKAVDYDESDVRQVSLLLDGMWRHIERERAEKALRNSESLAAMGRALSSVAHEIKTPLLAIGGFAKMVRRNLPQGSKDRERLDIVLQETGRLEKMVKDMLDFSRPLELQKSLEDACRMVKETLSIVNSAAEARDVTLEANLRQCDNAVPMDGWRIKQVLINLIMNAIQASPKGEIVMVNLHRQKREIIFDVVDCGSGISHDQRSEIFSPFFTTKKEGTGLGLSIVKKIVDAHKGRIEVLDNPGAGVTFRVVLPIAASGGLSYQLLVLSKIHLHENCHRVVSTKLRRCLVCLHTVAMVRIDFPEPDGPVERMRCFRNSKLSSFSRRYPIIRASSTRRLTIARPMPFPRNAGRTYMRWISPTPSASLFKQPTPVTALSYRTR